MGFYFLSDLHLREANSKKASDFISFLTCVPKPGDSVLIGGDLFDLFVGAKDVFVVPFGPVIKALRDCAERGVNIHYAEGNHDFYLADVFRSSSRIQIHADAFSVGDIWVAHGDRIDPEDRGYHLLRAVTRSKFVELLIKFFPDRALSAIGNWSSRQSRKYNNRDNLSEAKTLRTRDLFRQYAQQKIKDGFSIVFLGHSHIEDRCDWDLGSHGGVYVNLGFSTELTYASWNHESRSLQIQRYTS